MTQSTIRKIYFGVADRRQMCRLFDRHAQRTNRVERDSGDLYAGEYFEIGDEPDRIVAFRIVDRLRRRADVVKEIESFDELYGRFLMAAAAVLIIGTAFLRKRTELTWQAAGAAAVVLLLASIA